MRRSCFLRLGALASMAFHTAAYAQPQTSPLGPESGMLLMAPLVAATEAASPEEAAGESGQMFRTSALPAPAAGKLRLLRFSAPGAAAYRLYFEGVALPAGARMFLYGLDTSGHVTTVFGPYEQSGPLAEGSFRSRVIPGAEAVVEIQDMDEGPWPMRVPSVAAIDAGLLADMRMAKDPSLSEAPEERMPPRGERLQVDFNGRLVMAEVVGDDVIAEGDMIIGSARELAAGGAAKDGRKLAVMRTEASGHWNGGVIPLEFDAPLGSDPRIIAALQTWSSLLSGLIQFVPHTTQHDFVRFRVASSGCFSGVGRISGAQTINLSSACSTGNVRHEIGHALGFHHEQTREDRDNYVRILWDNIQSGFEHNFDKNDGDSNTDIGAYDFASIMHYALNAFSKNGMNTIEPKKPIPAGVVVGQRTAPSAGDVAAVRDQYGVHLTPRVLNVPAAGGTFAVRVSTGSDRAWTARDDATWVTLTSGTSGQGDGVINFTVASNFPVATQGVAPITGGNAAFPIGGRTANLQVGLLPFATTATVQIIQAAPDCSYGVSPTKIVASPDFGTYTVTVTTAPGCTWGATEALPWVLSVSPVSGQGTAAVSVRLDDNYPDTPNKPGTAPKRTGTIMVAGHAVTIEQAGGTVVIEK
jgi:hypothetical protein